MKHEHALIYLKYKEHQELLISLLNKYQFQYTWIGDDDLKKEVISLFEKEIEETINNAFSFNFILFRNIDHTTIKEFYKDCRNQNINLSHKAILTEHNAHWLLKDLLIEIEEEHTFFTKWEELHLLLKEANNIPADEYTSESYETYKTAFLKAYIYTKTMPDKTQIDKIIKDIKDSKSKLRKH